MIKSKKMKLIIKINLFFLIGTFLFAAPLKIGVVSDFDYKVAEFIKSKSEVDIEIVKFETIDDSNDNLVKRKIDLNLFQTLDHLKNYNSKNKGSLKKVAELYIYPIGIYSKNHSSIKDIEEGAIIAIPKDKIEASRSLKLLNEVGLIELSSGKTIFKKEDIVKNKFNIKIVEVSSTILPRFLEIADFVVLSGEEAFNLGYSPESDSVFLENVNYNNINVVAVREKSLKRRDIIRVIKDINSKETKLFILEIYGDNIIISR